jgi:hypothetical protein
MHAEPLPIHGRRIAGDLISRRPRIAFLDLHAGIRGALGGALVACFLLVPESAAAQPSPTPTLRVGHAAEGQRPLIDGRVDDAVWAQVEPFTALVQQEPNVGEAASERTELRFLVDRQTLYVAVVCFDSEPQNILVSQSRRDADLADTDSIRILLDAFNDGQNAFVFGTNPFGIEYDGQVMAEGQTGQTGGGGGGAGFNVNWDADWTVRAQITERGWEAEFAIPLRTLRYNPGDDRTWGVNAMRNIRRKNEQVFLAPIPRGYNLYRVSVAGKLHGLSLPVRRDIRLLPYAAAAVTDDKTLRTNTVDRSGDVGLDFKWGVRADLTLDLTINTDFAQVEADEQPQPHEVSTVLRGETPVLPGERAAVPVGTTAGDRPVLLATDRTLRERRADRHRGWWTLERQAWRIQRRYAEHANRGCDRSAHRPSRRFIEQLQRRSAAAREGTIELRGDVRRQAGLGRACRASGLQPRVRAGPGVAGHD